MICLRGCNIDRGPGRAATSGLFVGGPTWTLAGRGLIAPVVPPRPRPRTAISSRPWYRASKSQMQGLGTLPAAGIYLHAAGHPRFSCDVFPALPRSRDSLPLLGKTRHYPVSAHLGFSYQRWDRPLAQGSRVPCSAAYPQIVHYKGKPVLLPRRRRVPTSDSSSYLGRLHNGGGGKGFMMS